MAYLTLNLNTKFERNYGLFNTKFERNYGLFILKVSIHFIFQCGVISDDILKK